MNKFFTKIAGVALGLTMAIGVGVAVGSSQKEVKHVHAEAEKFYSVLGSTTGSNNAYATAEDIVCTNNLISITWSVKANATLNPWKFGGKGFTSDTADVVDIEVDKWGHDIKLEILDNGLIHFWSHSFDLELVQPFCSTAIIQLKEKE